MGSIADVEGIHDTIKNGKHKELLQLDEITRARCGNGGSLLRLFAESAINFPPTYKFMVGGAEREYQLGQSGSKARVPAWCDRVLYRGHVDVLKYDHLPHFTQSDHKPVLAVLELNKPYDEKPSMLAPWWGLVNVSIKLRREAQRIRHEGPAATELKTVTEDGAESDGSVDSLDTIS